jgi:hypothetical protein
MGQLHSSAPQEDKIKARLLYYAHVPCLLLQVYEILTIVGLDRIVKALKVQQDLLMIGRR